MADALWTADMTTGPDGEELAYGERLSEILTTPLRARFDRRAEKILTGCVPQAGDVARPAGWQLGRTGLLWEPKLRPKLRPNSPGRRRGRRVGPAFLLVTSGGSGGIRTPGPSRDARFQGECIRPLCHASMPQATRATRCRWSVRLRYARPARSVVDSWCTSESSARGTWPRHTR